MIAADVVMWAPLALLVVYLAAVAVFAWVVRAGSVSEPERLAALAEELRAEARQIQVERDRVNRRPSRRRRRSQHMRGGRG